MKLKKVISLFLTATMAFSTVNYCSATSAVVEKKEEKSFGKQIKIKVKDKFSDFLSEIGAKVLETAVVAGTAYLTSSVTKSYLDPNPENGFIHYLCNPGTDLPENATLGDNAFSKILKLLGMESITANTISSFKSHFISMMFFLLFGNKIRFNAVKVF